MKDQKNLLIGGLLAIVLVMAVGYAAYSTTLTINGTAKASMDWCLGFDTTKTNDASGVVTKTGTGSSASIQYGATCKSEIAPTVTLNANLLNPGDTVTYKLTIKNGSTALGANLGTPSISMEKPAGWTTSCTSTECTATADKGGAIVKWSIVGTVPTAVAAQSTQDITVKAEFVDGTVTSLQTATIPFNVTIVGTQA